MSAVLVALGLLFGMALTGFGIGFGYACGRSMFKEPATVQLFVTDMRSAVPSAEGEA